MNWIMENVHTLLTIITSVISTASLVAALTPSASDDRIISRLRQIIDLLALNIGHAKKS